MSQKINDFIVHLILVHGMAKTLGADQLTSFPMLLDRYGGMVGRNGVQFIMEQKPLLGIVRHKSSTGKFLWRKIEALFYVGLEGGHDLGVQA